MFAVPGWNVSAKSLVAEQAKPIRDKSTNASAESVNSTFTAKNSGTGNSKKRKRTQDGQKQGSAAIRKSQHQSHNASPPPQANIKHRKHHDLTAKSSNPSQSARKIDPKKFSLQSQDDGGTNGCASVPNGALDPGGSHDKFRSHHQTSKKQVNRVENETSSGDSCAREPCRTQNQASDPNATKAIEPAWLPPMPPPSASLTPLQAKMRAKLTAARFRHLNETLYTTSSENALQLFANSPDLFAEYHAGFSHQVQDSWPQNPVNLFIKAIKARAAPSSPVNNAAPLPRRKSGICTVADLGCGDAPLARGLQSVIKKSRLKLFNFDLQAPNQLVTIADIAALPLRDGEVDIAIFCLSLMGTNWLAFVEEAWRILRGDGNGEIWVAEVKSRFGRLSARRGPGAAVENSVGKKKKPHGIKQSQLAELDNDGQTEYAEDVEEVAQPGADDDTDLQPFIDSFHRRGFMLRKGSMDKSNKMFVTMVFTKSGVPGAGKWKGMKWNGKQYQRTEDHRRKLQGDPGRFTDEEGIDEKEEGKLLKPCVYKLR